MRHDVQRPRPPHVAVTSTPPSCAALSSVVPLGAEMVRATDRSRGSITMVRRTATGVDCSILADMTPPAVTLDTMRTAMKLAGFSWSDAELEALRPGLERALAS